MKNITSSSEHNHYVNNIKNFFTKIKILLYNFKAMKKS